MSRFSNALSFGRLGTKTAGTRQNSAMCKHTGKYHRNDVENFRFAH